MFESVNDFGNNHYIDNIKVSGTCATTNNSSADNDQIKIYPVPMESFAVIDFGTLKPDIYRIINPIPDQLGNNQNLTVTNQKMTRFFMAFRISTYTKLYLSPYYSI